MLEDDSGDPIVDRIGLNSSLKVFSGVDGTRTASNANLNESLQLTPFGCDSDKDGVIDELDACPVDGPNDFDVNGDGCED